MALDSVTNCCWQELFRECASCGERPFGRSYHSAEGFSNGFMNRQGWHYANFDADSTAHRIALIGDSFIEAHEIPTKKHLGVRLESTLNSKTLMTRFTGCLR
ncbi:MAG: hypothetical protein R3C26_00985 [Calditrichia bacterium]